MSHSEQAHTEPVTPHSGQAPSKKHARPTPESPRKQRRDAGALLFTDRDAFALNWIGQQYGIRLDQLQRLLGRSAGRGATSPISEGAARDVVTRWKRGQWVRVARIRAHEPFWIWPTRLGLRKVGLTYQYRDLEQSSLDDLKHLYAINEVRLAQGNETTKWKWISERQLLQGVVRDKGKPLLHRPDAEIQAADGDIIAIEVELSLKKPLELAENLMELLRGQEYLRLKIESGVPAARDKSWGEQSHYTQIWYFAPPAVRQQVRKARARLIQQGDISAQEAERLFVRGYPPAKTEAEVQRDEQEDDESLDLDLPQT